MCFKHKFESREHPYRTLRSRVSSRLVADDYSSNLVSLELAETGTLTARVVLKYFLEENTVFYQSSASSIFLFNLLLNWPLLLIVQ